MDGVKIGIGVLTMGRRTINQKVFDKSIGDIFVYTDEERQGVAKSRNRILSHFKDYDHVFLFDDDCYPNREGWEEYIITECVKHNVHWMGLPVYNDTVFKAIDGEMMWVASSIGPFQYFSKKALEVIGGYNEEYNRYGFEDGGVEARAIKAGLTGRFPHSAFPVRAFGYIYSMDVNHDNPTENISFEEKQKYISQNIPIFLKEKASDQIFYPFE